MFENIRKWGGWISFIVMVFIYGVTMGQYKNRFETMEKIQNEQVELSRENQKSLEKLILLNKLERQLREDENN